MGKTDRPDAYRKGSIEFYKLRFKVTPDVLIPRPETELLVDAVLAEVKGKETTVLDIGTGAGSIAVSVAKNAPHVKVIATDISEKTLKVARQNARLHGVEGQITFIKSDLLSIVPSTLHPKPSTLIIVTNLPYIPSARIPYLDSSVKDFEPHLALDGGEDGFELYRKLFQQINDKGWQPKLILGEIDYTHGDLAYTEVRKFFPAAETEVKKDLAHLQRILKVSLIR